jgi:hypothetical protein
MTPELSSAIGDTQRLMQMDNADWSFLLEETEGIIAQMPGDDLEAKILEIRDTYLTILRFRGDMPEGNANLIALGFAEKLRQRLKEKK